jgi:hypothetical protein
MNIARPILAVAIASFPMVARAEPLQLAKDAPECKFDGGTKIYSVVDLSMPVPPLKTQDGRSVLQMLSEHGVHTIFRYYDQPIGEMPAETLPGKTLHADESQKLIDARFKIGVVYQHKNDIAAKFFPSGAGKEDAERALKQAEENKQPFNTAIYFGIDGPEENLVGLAKEYRANNGEPLSESRKDQLIHGTSEQRKVAVY